MAEARCLNVNVGVLGHVDSGKTTLVAALSTVLSTAALDKHPQSKERGITLDLGFSAFSVPLPLHLSSLPYDTLQFTLVDCPGHASLIKTIIGGAHILDIMVLVIDISKGIQVQTAECLVVGEITTQNILVVLNKIDLIKADSRERAIRKAKKQVSQTFKLTKFAGCKMIPVCAKQGSIADGKGKFFSVSDVAAELAMMVEEPPKRRQGPFLFAIDHCFQIKGHGTIMTGTALQGSIRVNDALELPELKESRKVKSMQMFKKNVKEVSAGDRAGICVTGLDASKIERGLACTPQTVPTFNGAVAWIDKVRFYPNEIKSKTKFHIVVGHTAVMATLTFFALPSIKTATPNDAMKRFLDRLNRVAQKLPPVDFDFSIDYKHQDSLYGVDNTQQPRYADQFGFLEFDQPLTAPKDSVLIGARLDTHAESSSCRLAFYGQVLSMLDCTDKAAKKNLRLFKSKRRLGVIERVNPDGVTAICKAMFKRETDITVFAGMKVTALCNMQVGIIEGAFGGGGKFKVHFPVGLSSDWETIREIELVFRRYIFDPTKTPQQ